MQKYQVYVDMVYNEDDWKDDNKVYVLDYVILAEDGDDAREKALVRARQEYPDNWFYVWEVSDEDILDE